MQRTLFTMHRTLCEIALYGLFLPWPQFKSLFFILVTFNEIVFMKKISKIWIRVFKIITKASWHICSLYAYITSLQHNIISKFFVMKYNLPTNLLFLLSLETQWNMFVIIFFYVDLSINLCRTPLSLSFLSA